MVEVLACGKEHIKMDFLQNEGRRPHIYSAQEVQIVGDVGKRIPRIYVALDNTQEDHQVYIIENMDGKLCGQVVSILIDPRSNYNYVNPDFVSKCGLNK